MNARPRILDLWSRFLAGIPLDPTDQRRLAEAMETDERLRRDLLEDQGLASTLRALGRSPEADELFAGRFMDLVVAERQAEPFAARIEERLAEESARRSAARRRRWIWWPASLALGAAAAIWFHLGRPPAPPTAERAVSPGTPRVTASAGTRTPEVVPADLAPPTIPSASAVPSGEIVYEFVSPKGEDKFIGRDVRRCPPRPGGREGRCLVGVVYSPENLRSLRVVIGARDGLYLHRPGLFLVFDYWIGAWTGPRAPRLEVTLRVKGRRGRDFTAVIHDSPPTSWRTAVVSLDTLRASQRAWAHERLDPGDVVTFIKLVTDSGTQDVLYVDNLRIVGS